MNALMYELINARFAQALPMADYVLANEITRKSDTGRTGTR